MPTVDQPTQASQQTQQVANQNPTQGQTINRSRICSIVTNIAGGTIAAVMAGLTTFVVTGNDSNIEEKAKFVGYVTIFPLIIGTGYGYGNAIRGIYDHCQNSGLTTNPNTDPTTDPNPNSDQTNPTTDPNPNSDQTNPTTDPNQIENNV